MTDWAMRLMQKCTQWSKEAEEVAPDGAKVEVLVKVSKVPLSAMPPHSEPIRYVQGYRRENLMIRNGGRAVLAIGSKFVSKEELIAEELNHGREE